MTITARNVDTLEKVTDHRPESAPTLAYWRDVRREITDALGEHADSYDIDAIAADCYTLAALISDDGIKYGNPFFVQVVDTCEFWESAKRHDIS